MSLDKEVRDYLAKEFDIQPSKPTDVIIDQLRGNQIVSDGRTVDDLAKITPEKLAEFVKDSPETGTLRLLEIATSKVKGILHPPINVEVKELVHHIEKTIDHNIMAGIETKKRGRPAKKHA